MTTKVKQNLAAEVAARSLLIWMRTNWAEVERRFGNRPSWKLLAIELGNSGIRDRKGNPPNGHAVRESFLRAKRKPLKFAEAVQPPAPLVQPRSPDDRLAHVMKTINQRSGRK